MWTRPIVYVQLSLPVLHHARNRFSSVNESENVNIGGKNFYFVFTTNFNSFRLYYYHCFERLLGPLEEASLETYGTADYARWKVSAPESTSTFGFGDRRRMYIDFWCCQDSSLVHGRWHFSCDRLWSQRLDFVLNNELMAGSVSVILHYLQSFEDFMTGMRKRFYI